MIEYKGGACQLCGYRNHWAALTFHHVDPRLKRFNIAGAHNRGLDTLRDELDRCVLVCGNCHDELEEGVTSVPLELAVKIRSLTEHLPRGTAPAGGSPCALLNP
jgi:hypothetical protein